MADHAPVFHFVDPGFNYLLTRNYDLSIRFAPDGLSYAVFDTIKNRFNALSEFSFKASFPNPDAFGSEEYIDWLKEIFDQQIIFKSGFNKLLILTGGLKHTLIPKPLFEVQHNRKYLAFNHPLSPTDLVFHDHIKVHDSVFIYAVPQSLAALIDEKFGNARTFHTCSSLIRSFFVQFKSGLPATRILINIQKGNFDIIIFNGSQFSFCNSFSITSNTDLLYYVLFVVEQLKINPEEAAVYLSGVVEKKDEINSLLRKYLRFVDLIPPATDHDQELLLNRISTHVYYDLLNAFMCE